MTKQPENVDSESANQSANTGNPMCSTIWGSDTRRVYRSSIVSLWYLSPSCHSLPFRRRRVRPESDAESNHGIEWKELNLCWAFLGGLGLKEEFVKLNPLLLNSSSPTHYVLPNSTVSVFLKNGDGEDTHAQTPTRGNSTAVKEDDVLLHQEFCLPGPVIKNFTKPLNCHWHPPPTNTHMQKHPGVSQLPAAPRFRDSQAKEWVNHQLQLNTLQKIPPMQQFS